MTKNYIEKVYSGWLGKIIGIRLGAPIEGWTYNKIKDVYGEVHSYPVDYQNFAADDDSNGPLFFIRALEDCADINNFSSQDVANALLNYAPYEHGFFWWGGYGISTEHTAYLNLYNGMKSPQAGSIKQNGAAVAEQIGGQIFIDTWGLVAPNKPSLAADLARKAASVTHDGEGIYGGVFVAVCISLAFSETDVKELIEKALGYIPNDCEYTRVANAVIEFYNNNPNNWRECYQYIFDNFGYDKYPGACHIIPNMAVMILAMLYGENSFDDTLNICNMCGWDTDCNVGNVGCIMGLVCGIENINYEKWIKPINDFLASSSVIGSLNIQDISQSALYIAKLGYLLADEKMPAQWDYPLSSKHCHFELPHSTHAIRVNTSCLYNTINTNEDARVGNRSLKISINGSASGHEHYIYKQTYYLPEDFYDSRYDPCFSPIIYPGQSFKFSLKPKTIPSKINLYAQPYFKLGNTNEIIKGEKVHINELKWHDFTMKIPYACDYIKEIGVVLFTTSGGFIFEDLTVYFDDMHIEGKPDYQIKFNENSVETWNFSHKEINQFSRHKGMCFVENGYLSLSSNDCAQMLTGDIYFDDYSYECTVKPTTGETHLINFRVQGAMRSYAVGFDKNRIVLLKNEYGYSTLHTVDYNFLHETDYNFKIIVNKNKFDFYLNDEFTFTYTDKDAYLHGCIGISTKNGSRCLYKDIKVKGLD